MCISLPQKCRQSPQSERAKGKQTCGRLLGLGNVGKVGGVLFPVLFLVSPAMNSWLKTHISEGNPGAKLEASLRSPGRGAAGQRRTSARLEERCVLYFYFLS